MANNADHFIKALTAPPTRLAGAINSTSDNIGLENLEGIQSDTAVVMTIDRVDTNGEPTPELTEVVLGVLGNAGLENVVRGVGGKKQAHKSGAVVEVSVASSEQWNRLIGALLKTFNQDGTLKNNVVDSKHIKSVDGDKITVNSIDGDKISQKTINAKHLADDLLKISWKDVTDYQNGFGPYKSSGNYREPQYSKDAFGIVRLRGLAANPRGDVTDKAIFVLPADFRPQQTEIFTTPNAGTIGRINVLPNGEVHLSSAYSPNSTFVSLNGISFSTD